jgi:hypothetical protein
MLLAGMVALTGCISSTTREVKPTVVEAPPQTSSSTTTTTTTTSPAP